jgi:hypothetical protein
MTTVPTVPDTGPLCSPCRDGDHAQHVPVFVDAAQGRQQSCACGCVDDSLDVFLMEHESGRCPNPACRVTELERDVARLREDLANLVDDVEDVLSGRRSIHFAKVLRVRKLIVEEDDGFERVVVGEFAAAKGVHVMTRSDDPDDYRSKVALTATDTDGDMPEGVAVYLTGGGNILAQLEVRQVADVIDEQWVADLDGLGRPLYRNVLSIDQPNGSAGVVLDHNGVQLHPMRLAYELRHQAEKDAATRKVWAENGIVAK